MDINEVVASLAAKLDKLEEEVRYLTRWSTDGEFGRFICDPVIGGFGGQGAKRDIAAGMAFARYANPIYLRRQLEFGRSLIADYQAAQSEITRHIQAAMLPGASNWVARAEALERVIRSLARSYDAAVLPVKGSVEIDGETIGSENRQ